MVAPETHGPAASRRPQIEDLVPSNLPPEVAVARLVALAESLLIENRQLRELVRTSNVDGEADGDSWRPFDRGAAA